MNLGRWQRTRDTLQAKLARWCGTFPERGALHTGPCQARDAT